MKKIALFCIMVVLSTFITGCDLDELTGEVNGTSNVKCSVSKQYKDSFSYYVEGTCKNSSSKNFDYLQVEFVCYDKSGNNLGTAVANTNNLLANDTWKFKAISLVGDSSQIDHCNYHEVTGW